MKKRYGLVLTIGKKTKIRFSKQIEKAKNELLKLILPANKAVPEGNLSTTLIMKKQDPSDFCDNFNEQSCIYTTGTMLTVLLYLSAGTLLFEIGTPTLISLTNLVFTNKKTMLEHKMPTRSKIVEAAIHFAFLKMNTSKLYIHQIANFAKTFHGLLRSCRIETDISPVYYTEIWKGNFLINKKRRIPELYNKYKNWIILKNTDEFSIDKKSTVSIIIRLLHELDSYDIFEFFKNIDLELDNHDYYDLLMSYFYSIFNGIENGDATLIAYIILYETIIKEDITENNLEILDDYFDYEKEKELLLYYNIEH
jgi:ribosomal protein L11